MRLLGANEINFGLTLDSISIDEQFVPYYKRLYTTFENGRVAIFLFHKPPKYRYVTVPKNIRFKQVFF